MYSKEENFYSKVAKAIIQFGKVKEIICEGCSEQPHDWYIKFIDEDDNILILPLKPNDEADNKDFFNAEYHLTVLNLAFQKVLNQINEDGNLYWLLEAKQIDSVLEVLKSKLPFRTVTYNELWMNL